MAAPPGHRHSNWELVDRGRRAAVRCGLAEAVTYAFIDSEVDSRLAAWPLCPGAQIHLGNPLASTQATMRRSLVPGLLAAARDTLNQGERSISLFEEGRVFAQDGQDHVEPERLAVVLAGSSVARDGEVGFLELKGNVEALLQDIGFAHASWRRGGDPWLNPDEGAVVERADRTVVGAVGRLADEEAARWGFKVPVYVAEINLQEATEQPLPSFRELPRFPSVAADITVEHSTDLAYAELEATLSELAHETAEEVSLIARYSGKGLPSGAVRSTLRVVYRHADRSLTQDEVNQWQEALRSALAERLPVTLT
jgi:phenylalanyl-tRNA synthetase beta chain